MIAKIEIKSIPCYSGYYADATGQIYSTKQKGLKRLKQVIGSNGYYQVCIRNTTRNKVGKVEVHKLVAAAFLGERPLKLLICHGNSAKLDNRVDNLRYDTAFANDKDRLKNGTYFKRGRHKRILDISASFNFEIPESRFTDILIPTN